MGIVLFFKVLCWSLNGFRNLSGDLRDSITIFNPLVNLGLFERCGTLESGRWVILARWAPIAVASEMTSPVVV